MEELLELAQAAAGGIGLGFDLHVENVVLALDEEIHLVGWVHLAPIAGHDLKLGNQGLKHIVFCERPLELREKPFALSKGRREQLRQAAEQTNVHFDSGNPAKLSSRIYYNILFVIMQQECYYQIYILLEHF